MKKPILVVMAAGMGSRYGGLKQLDPVGPNGEVIMDYSLFDAKRAGFERVIFIIKHSIENEFKEKIGRKAEKNLVVSYAFQETDDLPEGFTPPAGREKPWGTAHALLSARHLIDAPFAVINADDYYGPRCFSLIYDYLTETSAAEDTVPARFCMAAYQLKNTVTENGAVARGVCEVDPDNYLVQVTEHTQIETYSNGIHFTEDKGVTWQDIAPDTPVSMNLWGFTPAFLTEAWKGFPAFLQKALQENPLKAEYFLPSVVSSMIDEHLATVKVLNTPDKWHGVTYREDKPDVVRSLAALTGQGLYPSPLWK